MLVVTNLYPPHSYGGYEDLCAGAVRAWAAAGDRVEVLASRLRRHGVESSSAPSDVTVRRTLPIYLDEHRLLDPPLMTCLRWERDCRRAVEEAVQALRPEVVSIWNPGALPFGLFTYLRRHGLPIVLVIGDRWLDFGLETDGWSRRFTGLGRVLAPVVSAVTGLSTRVGRLGDPVYACFASEHLRRHARKHSPWELDASALVPHGLDLDRYPLVEPVGQRWDGRLLFVGRVAPDKGIAVALRAVRRLPGTALDVIGPGDRAHVRELSDLADELGVAGRVRFRGEAGPQRLRDAYRSADALVFPSSWPEPFGIVPLEAMASGLPVVGTATGGSGEFLIDAVTALCFPPGDAAALTSALRRLGDDPDLRMRIRRGGRDVAAWLSRSRTYEQLAAWNRFAAGRRADPPSDRPLLPPSLRDMANGAG